MGIEAEPGLGVSLHPQPSLEQALKPVGLHHRSHQAARSRRGRVIAWQETLNPTIESDQENPGYYVRGFLWAKIRKWGQSGDKITL